MTRARTNWAALLLAFGLAVAASAAASDAPGAASNDCAQARSTATMRACANDRYHAAVRRMDAAYDALERSLTVPQKALLRRAQSAWLQYRDATSDLEADRAGDGTLRLLVRATIRADLTEQRAAALANDGGAR